MIDGTVVESYQTMPTTFLLPRFRQLIIFLLCLSMLVAIAAAEIIFPVANNNATSLTTSFPRHFLVGSDSKERMNVLKNIQSGKHKQCHYFPIHARDEFFDHSWDKVIGVEHGSNPVLVYNPCMSTYNLGNSLGNYFNELACALATNISLVIGTKLWIYPTMPIEFKGDKASPHIHRPKGAEHEHKISLTFFESLPDGIWKKPSSSVPSWSAVESSMKQLCPCEKYCWSHGQAPWIRHHTIIREVSPCHSPSSLSSTWLPPLTSYTSLLPRHHDRKVDEQSVGRSHGGQERLQVRPRHRAKTRETIQNTKERRQHHHCQLCWCQCQ